jgi:hypothetical protein
MLIIADKRIPEQAKANLQQYSEVLWLETRGITEESISGHPDIFFCQTNRLLFVAPNLPEVYKKTLSDKNIHFVEGSKSVGLAYPASAEYNVVATKKHIIHRTDITEQSILNDCSYLQQINVRQGFARCSLLPLNDNHFITSDEGIYKTLVAEGLTVLQVSARDIILPGQSYGFFGGACGVYENKIFIIGSLAHYPGGEKVISFVSNLGYEIIELYNGPLFDGGSIMFIG